MIFCISIFIFCLEPTVSEQLDENDFHHYYGIFFESTILKVLDHNYVHSPFATITKYFDNGIWNDDNAIWNDALQLKILRTWITTRTKFF